MDTLFYDRHRPLQGKEKPPFCKCVTPRHFGCCPSECLGVARDRQFAFTDSPVLLCGKTGSGKEMFAQAIHTASPRRKAHGQAGAVRATPRRQHFWG